MSTQLNTGRLRNFIVDFAGLIDRKPAEHEILEQGKQLLAGLVSNDDWLPEQYAQPDDKFYRQYLLHTDSRERFSVVSFVWGPGQFTPIHNHTVWGIIGVLRGSEVSQSYDYNGTGKLVPQGEPAVISPGEVEVVSPTVGDLHQVRNAHNDKVSISIHVYGANIGAVKRSVFYEDGVSKEFISGYSNDVLPNIWDRSKEK